MIPDPKVTEVYLIIQEHVLQDAKTKKRNRKFTMSSGQTINKPQSGDC